MPDIFQLANDPLAFHQAVGSQPPPTGGYRDIFQLANDPIAFHQAVNSHDPREEEERRRRREDEERQRLANTPSGQLMTAINTERERRSNQSAAGYIAENAVGAVGRRLPFIGRVVRIGEAMSARAAAIRLRDNKAQEGDIDTVARFMLDTEESQKRGFLGKVWDIVTELPAFATEFALTKGAFTAGRAFAMRGVEAAANRAVASVASTAATSAARTAAGVAAREAIGFGGGVVAQTLANPLLVLQESARRSLPEITPGENGELNVSDPGSIGANIGAGFLDTAIELGSERAGAALPWLARQAGRIPKVGPKLTEIGQAWIGSAPGRTVARWEGGIARFMQRMGVPYHGVAGEVFEERVGEVLRGLTGLGDFGVAGDVLSGRLGDAGEQLLTEAIAFSAIPFSVAAANKAMMKARGFSFLDGDLQGMDEATKAAATDAHAQTQDEINRAVAAVRLELTESPGMSVREVHAWIDKTFKDKPQELRDLLKNVAQSMNIWGPKVGVPGERPAGSSPYSASPASQVTPEGGMPPPGGSPYDRGDSFEHVDLGQGASSGEAPPMDVRYRGPNAPTRVLVTPPPYTGQPGVPPPGTPGGQSGDAPPMDVSYRDPNSPPRVLITPPPGQEVAGNAPQSLQDAPGSTQTTSPGVAPPEIPKVLGPEGTTFRYETPESGVLKITDEAQPTEQRRMFGDTPEQRMFGDQPVYRKNDVVRVPAKDLVGKIVADLGRKVKVRMAGAAPGETVEVSKSDLDRVGGNPMSSKQAYSLMRQAYPENVQWERADNDFHYGVYVDTSGGSWEVVASNYDKGVEFFNPLGGERYAPFGPRKIMAPEGVSQEEYVSMQDKEEAEYQALKDSIFKNNISQLEGVNERVIGPLRKMAQAVFQEDPELKAQAAQELFGALTMVLGRKKYADRVMMRLAPEYGGKGMTEAEIAAEESRLLPKKKTGAPAITESAIQKFLATKAKELGFKDGFPKAEVATSIGRIQPETEQVSDLLIEGVVSEARSRPDVTLKDYEDAAQGIVTKALDEIAAQVAGNERAVTSEIVRSQMKKGKAPKNELIYAIYKEIREYVSSVAKKYGQRGLPDMPPIASEDADKLTEQAKAIVGDYIKMARERRDKNKPVGQGFEDLPELFSTKSDPTQSRVDKLIDRLYSIGREPPKFEAKPGVPPPGTPDSPAKPGMAKSPLAIKSWMEREFGTRSYTTPEIANNPSAGAVALLGPKTIITTSGEEQNIFTAIEEQFHILNVNNDFEANPYVLPPDVAKGILEFGELDGHDGEPTRRNIYEGAAAWYLYRTIGKLSEVILDSPTMKAADQYLEDWTKTHKLDGKSDSLKAMVMNYLAADPIEAAALFQSYTGKPVPAPSTWKEQAGTVLGRATDWFLENVENDLWPLEKLKRLLKSRGQSTEYIDYAIGVFSQYNRRAASLAEQWDLNGVYGLENNAERSYSRGAAFIRGNAKAEWLTPIKDLVTKGASIATTIKEALGFYEGEQTTMADVYLTANHLIREREAGQKMIADQKAAIQTIEAAMAVKGLSAKFIEGLKQQLEMEKARLVQITEKAEVRMNLVPDHQFKTYQVAHQVLMENPEFAAWGPGFAVRVNDAFNATLRVLASPDVHRLNRTVVEDLIEKYTDENGGWFVPTTRLREDSDWKMDPMSPSPGRGEKQRKILHTRTGGGEPIIAPLQSLSKRYLTTAGAYIEQLKRNAIARVLLQPGMGNVAVLVNANGVLGSYPVLDDNKLANTVGNSFFDMQEMRSILGAYALDPGKMVDQSKPHWFWYGPEGDLYAFQFGDRNLYNLATNRQGDDSTFVQMLRGIINWDIGEIAGHKIRPVGGLTSAVRRGATTLNMGYTLLRNTFITRDPYEFLKNTVNMASAARLPEMYKRTFLWEMNVLMGRLNNDYPLQLFMEHFGGDLRMIDFAPSTDTVVTEYSYAKWLLDKAKQVLRTTSSPELAPRFLEWLNIMAAKGWTEEKLDEFHKMAIEEKEFSNIYQSPIPFDVLIESGQGAAESTVPFGRQGVITRELNRIIPFFGPAVAGMSKSIRNWKDNPKGAATGLGAMLTLRAMHWLIVHDEDWYKELSPADRFSNMVISIPGIGPVRFPGFRDLDVPVGGMMISVFEAAAKQNPDFPGLLRQSIEAGLPPGLNQIANDVADRSAMGVAMHTLGLPLGPLGVATTGIIANRGWGGRPIVPRREEATTEWSQNVNYRIPYLLDQTLGGRDVTSLKGLGLVPFSRVANNRRSMDEVYERLDNLARQRTEARRQLREYAREEEYQILNRAADRLNELSTVLRGQVRTREGIRPGDPPTPEEAVRLQNLQLEIARAAIDASEQARSRTR